MHLIISVFSALGPGRVKTFFILQNYTQPGVIHADATI
jgi:hypothetical protein